MRENIERFGGDPGRVPVMTIAERRATLADKMSDAWIAFARSGKPDTPKLPKWTPYDATIARPWC